jgi:D-glycero-alpha-D-manno-heptose 1-phosphate guanylyltransferase
MNNLSKETIAVILAGGFGTRVKHLLPNIPKPMAEVAGKPFLEWIIRYLNQQNIEQFILSTGYLGEIIANYFATNPVKNTTIKCYRETKALGTGGGFLHAVKQSQQSPSAWLITNGDSLIFSDLAPLFNYLEHETAEGAILGLYLEDASRYGSLTYDSDYNLISFAEKKSGAGVINAGVYLFKNTLINQFPSGKNLSFEHDVFPQLLEQNCQIKVHITQAPFLDIGTPESLAQADSFIRKNLGES